MAKESYPGPAGSVTGRTSISCCDGGSTGSHRCVSPPESLMLSSGSSVLLQAMGSFMAVLAPGFTVSSSSFKVLRPDLALL